MAEQREPRRARERRSGEILATADARGPLPAPPTEPAGPLAFVDRAQDVMTVRRVFGDPIERNGVTILPVASVGGGGGGGGGEGKGPDERTGRGWGGGYGVSARPAGVYVIRGDQVTWRPAIDVNRTIFMGQIVGIVFLLTVRSVVKALAKRR